MFNKENIRGSMHGENAIGRISKTPTMSMSQIRVSQQEVGRVSNENEDLRNTM